MYDADDRRAAELVRRPQYELPAVHLRAVPGLHGGQPGDLVRVQGRSHLRAQRGADDVELLLAVLTDANDGVRSAPLAAGQRRASRAPRASSRASTPTRTALRRPSAARVRRRWPSRGATTQALR